jgi:bacillithiol synthase
MKIQQIPFAEAHSFGKLFLDYINDKEELKFFYSFSPEKKSFIEAAQKRNFNKETRSILVAELEKQYSHLAISDAVKANLNLLKNDNTFTITTGHQLCLAGGPLYFIYKIITAIKSCLELNKEQTDFHFVPVFWMASEDHDFEEINHFYHFGKKIEWNTAQKGAVGRFNLDNINEVFEDIKDIPDFVKKAYSDGKNLSDATRIWVNQLFGELGLIILDADSKGLKKIFSEVIKNDVLDQKAFNLVNTQSEKLIKLGYGAQVSPREINFFYLGNNSRERIVKENGKYKVNNTEKTFTEEEILSEIENNPENFSPNVIFRPLYQEMILPNISYIGGPGEIAYWLQINSVFEHYIVPFPILQPRNFILYITENLNKRIEKFGFSNAELFKDIVYLKEKYKNENMLKVSFEEEKEGFLKLFEVLKQKVKTIDSTLEATVLGELQKNQSGIELISKKVDKSIEQKNEQSISQITGLKEKLFPNGTLQERHDNFISIYVNNPAFIVELIDTLEPFNYQMNVVKV